MSELSYMEKLLDGIEVEWRDLEEVVKIQRGKRLVKSQLETSGNYAVYQNSMTPLGYYYESNAKADTTFIISAGAAGEIGYSDVDFWAADDVYLLLTQDSIESKFLYHFLLLQQYKILAQVRRASIPRLSRIAIEKLQIPIPPLNIQSEIVRILDTFTELTAELTAELTVRQQQYAYYRDECFNFNDNEVEWETLGVVSKIQRGASPRPIAKYVTDDKSGVPWIKIGDTRLGSKFVDNTAQRITFEGAEKSRVLKKGSFIMSNSMSYGRPYILGIEGAIHDGWASISDFEAKLNPDFLYHYLSSGNVKKYWESKINSSSVSNLNSDIIKALPVPIPPIDEQERIASILDKFDTLTTSLTEGLPREIELRKQQYEYYRDQLLSFPKPEVVAHD